MMEATSDNTGTFALRVSTMPKLPTELLLLRLHCVFPVAVIRFPRHPEFSSLHRRNEQPGGKSGPDAEAGREGVRDVSCDEVEGKDSHTLRHWLADLIGLSDSVMGGILPVESA